MNEPHVSHKPFGKKAQENKKKKKNLGLDRIKQFHGNLSKSVINNSKVLPKLDNSTTTFPEQLV